MVRVLLGVILLAVALWGNVSTAWVVLAVIGGVIGLITGLAGRCPLYMVAGIQTCGRAA